jgi:lipid A 4'-phosphatase
MLRGGDMTILHWTAWVLAPGRVAPMSVLLWSTLAFLVAAAVFLSVPQIDTGVASLFYNSPGQFSGRSGLIETARNGFKGVYIAAVICALGGMWLAHSFKIKLMRLSFTRWLVVFVTLFVGPGLVANVILKNEWGRARPSQTEQFGGAQQFTPALMPAAQCARNCSFISGEASSMFAVFFGLAMVTGPMARRYFAIGLIAGGVAGVIRMAQGAHYLSDVVFAGIFMSMTAVFVRFLVMDLRSYWLRQLTAVQRFMSPS